MGEGRRIGGLWGFWWESPHKKPRPQSSHKLELCPQNSKKGVKGGEGGIGGNEGELRGLWGFRGRST